MKGLIAGAFFAPLVGLGANATALAQEFPTYESHGYPLTPLQFQVLGSEHVQERPLAATLERDGMPASPHQLAVLRHTNGREH